MLPVQIKPDRKPSRPQPAESGRGLLLFTTLAGALIGFLAAPMIQFTSYADAQYLWVAECTMSGAAAGASAGLLTVIIWRRFQFSVIRLLEIVVVAAILVGLCRNALVAKWRFEDSERQSREELYPYGN